MKELFAFCVCLFTAFCVQAQNVDVHPASTDTGYPLQVKLGDGVGYLVDWYPYRWGTNMYFDVDTTAAGISADDVLAPVVTVSLPRSGRPVRVNDVKVIGGDKTTVMDFNLLFCGAALTCPATNAAAVLSLAELRTNLYHSVARADGNWRTAGSTNIIWCSTNFTPFYVQPLADSLYVYSTVVTGHTNTNAARLVLFLDQ